MRDELQTVFLLPVLGHPRHNKRIDALARVGVCPSVLGFERDYIPMESIPAGVRLLGRVRHGHYFARISVILRGVPKVWSAVRKADVVYAFGLDMLFLGWMSLLGGTKRLKLVYEVGDIREILLGPSLAARALRFAERLLLQRVDILVVTSKAYVQGYYESIQGLRQLAICLIENKLSEHLVLDPRPPRERGGGEAIRIGYFGVLRCRRSWEILKEVARRGNGRFEVYLRGVPLEVGMLEAEASEAPHIFYGGPYKSPADLPELYGGIDIAWICYPYSPGPVGNWLWARTNRFYEACYFQRPMLCQHGTQDAAVVEEYEIGMSIDLADVDAAVMRILRLSDAELEQWTSRVKRLPRELYVYSGEHEELLNRLAKAREGTRGYAGPST